MTEPTTHILRSAPPSRLKGWWDGGKLDVALHVGAPALTLGLVALVTTLAGVGAPAGCNGVQIFLWNLTGQTVPASTCTSVPFLADAPTILLSLTCPFALAGYYVMARRQKALLADLERNGVIAPGTGSSLPLPFQWLRTGVPHVVIRFGLLVLSFVITFGLYTWALDSNFIFTLLASEDHPSEQLQATWWANIHEHRALGIMTLAIATMGIYYAIRVGAVYVAFGQVIRKVTTASTVTYVPSWRDTEYGWQPVTSALKVIYFSAINLAISCVAVFHMIRSTVGLAVAGALALVGVIMNAQVILAPLGRVNRAHVRIKRQLRHELEQTGTPLTSRRVEATADLTSWRKIRVFDVAAGSVLAALYSIISNLGPFLVAAAGFLARLRGET